jgi:hypothetical protein
MAVRHPRLPPSLRFRGDGTGTTARATVKRTSQQEFAIWQPAWPTRRVQSQYQQIPAVDLLKAVWRRGGWGGVPFKLMTSLMVGDGPSINWGI